MDPTPYGHNVNQALLNMEPKITYKAQNDFVDPSFYNVSLNGQPIGEVFKSPTSNSRWFADGLGSVTAHTSRKLASEALVARYKTRVAKSND